MILKHARLPTSVLSAWLALSALGCASEYKLGEQTPSPGGSLIAVAYVRMGGGAAGWCDEHIALIPKNAVVNPAQIDKEIASVFSVSCDSIVKLTWISDDELHISYTIGDGVSVYQRSRGFEGHGRLVYLPQP